MKTWTGATIDKTSAVHFLRFEFPAAAIAALRAGASLAFGIEDPRLPEFVQVPDAARCRALVRLPALTHAALALDPVARPVAGPVVDGPPWPDADARDFHQRQRGGALPTASGAWRMPTSQGRARSAAECRRFGSEMPRFRHWRDSACRHGCCRAKTIRWVRESDYSPTDLALGWGPMSAPGMAQKLHVSQAGRWYRYGWGGDGPPIPPEQIVMQQRQHAHGAGRHCRRAIARTHRRRRHRPRRWLADPHRRRPGLALAELAQPRRTAAPAPASWSWSARSGACKRTAAVAARCPANASGVVGACARRLGLRGGLPFAHRRQVRAPGACSPAQWRPARGRSRESARTPARTSHRRCRTRRTGIRPLRRIVRAVRSTAASIRAMSLAAAASQCGTPGPPRQFMAAGCARRKNRNASRRRRCGRRRARCGVRRPGRGPTSQRSFTVSQIASESQIISSSDCSAGTRPVGEYAPIRCWNSGVSSGSTPRRRRSRIGASAATAAATRRNSSCRR